MSAPAARERTLLTVRDCRVQLLPGGPEGPCGATPRGAAPHADDVIAAGTLRLRLRSGAAAAELHTLTVQGSGHFSLQCTASSAFTAEAGRLVFEYPPGSGMACSLSAAEDAIQKLVAKLQGRGFKVQRIANDGVTWAARGVESTGSFLASAIKAAGAAAGGGIRAAGAVAVGSGLLEPERVELPPSARGAAAGARGVTRSAAGLAGKALEAVVSGVGTAAATVGTSMPEPTEQWMVDTKVMGASSLRAGCQVWQALQDASTGFFKELADTSSDVIGHKYGSEARKAARDSMHAVGNVLEVKAAVSKTVVGVIVRKSSPQVADALEGNHKEAAGTQLCVPPSSSQLARAVVRSALTRAAAAGC